MLRRIQLSNFKTFADATIELAPLTLVLGANGVGKSNLFDALRLLKSVGDRRSIRDAIEGHATSSPAAPAVPGIRGGSDALPTFGAHSTEFTITVWMEVDRENIEYCVCIDAKTYRVVSEELRSNKHPGPYVFSTHPETGVLEQQTDSPAIIARFHKETPGLNPRREFSPYDFILSQFRERRAESRLNENVADKARRELASIRPLELRPEVLRQYSPVGRSELGEHGENFAAVAWQLLEEVEFAEQWRRMRGFRRHQERQLKLEGTAAEDQEVLSEPTFFVEGHDENGHDDYEEPGRRLASVKAWLSELAPRSVTEVAVERAPTGEVIFALKEEGHDQVISARSLSDGTLRFAALTFAALGIAERQTLVIEEVENGINPARLALLIRMLEQTTGSSNDIQVIASTHSPGLLDFASDTVKKSAVVIGWDAATRSSRPMLIGNLPEIDKIQLDTTLGALQAEGWLQFAADG